MCDIDHFKTINDKHGHQVGDDVLAIIAALIGKRCGPSDLAARYGGEEFLVVLPGQASATAAVWANELRKELQAQIMKPQAKAFKMTASFGVASFPEQGGCCNDVISFADRALYAAKRGGRNQVRIAEAPRMPGSVPPSPNPAISAMSDMRR
jgi:diguanylate cyclase (GGDEF)-like protein